MTHYWYTRSGEFGTDLLSLDIQRGRDHGIPAYVHFRKYCNLSEVLSFKDLGNVVVQPVRFFFLHILVENRNFYETQFTCYFFVYLFIGFVDNQTSRKRV